MQRHFPRNYTRSICDVNNETDHFENGPRIHCGWQQDLKEDVHHSTKTRKEIHVRLNLGKYKHNNINVLPDAYKDRKKAQYPYSDGGDYVPVGIRVYNEAGGAQNRNGCYAKEV